MSRFSRTLLVLLVVLLGVSLALNAYLFRKGMSYYVSASRAQLDPFGLGAHPLGPQEIDRSKGPVVVFFGDSRAAAWPAPPQVPGVQFINRGIPGEMTPQSVGRFPLHVAPLRPQRVVIQLGINDLSRIPVFPDRRDAIVANCKRNLRQLVELATASGAQVTLCTIFPTAKVPLRRRPFWSGEVDGAVREVNAFIHSLESERVAVFDAYATLVDPHGVVASRYALDFLHLNAEGYAALNAALSPMLP